MQVVYHANYLRFCDRARTQWMQDLGIDLTQPVGPASSTFVVADAHVRFVKPARLGDELTVTTRVEALGRASVTFFQHVEEATTQRSLCKATIKCAHVAGPDFKPTRLPAHYHSLLLS